MIHTIKTKLAKIADQVIWKSINKRRPYDFERAAFWMAALEAVDFIEQRMPDAENFKTRLNLLDLAVKITTMDGLCLEFDVTRGETIKHIANQTKSEIYGFDSFEGLPEDWTPSQRKGRFSLNGQIPQNMPVNVHFVKGWFDDTLPGFLEINTGIVAFLHIDSDLYSSAKTILTCLRERFVPGTIIVFDELLNYPGWKNGEIKAWDEFVDETNISYEFFGFASSAHSVCLIIK
jgi:hypothetical protein